MPRISIYFSFTLSIIMIGLTLISSLAHAQAGEWQGAIGAGVSYAPRYDGDAENQLRIVPLLDINYNKDSFFISVRRGIGFNFSKVKYFQYGVSVLLGQARSEHADERLYGMGNIDYYPEGNLFFSARLGVLSFSGNVASSNYGTHANFGSNLVIPIGSANNFRLGSTVIWGDSIYNQTYFGVTTAQATASGNLLTPYSPAAGKVMTTLNASWTHNFNKSWFSTFDLGYKRLEGSAQLSPLNQRTSMLGETVMLGYHF
jgi:outer membrane scaffolding protein for murein synthesis (MipA/OmpV family)